VPPGGGVRRDERLGAACAGAAEVEPDALAGGGIAPGAAELPADVADFPCASFGAACDAETGGATTAGGAPGATAGDATGGDAVAAGVEAGAAPVAAGGAG